MRGGTVVPGDPVGGEWSLAVVGPHVAAALSAHDLGPGLRGDERFAFHLTHDRDAVVAAAARSWPGSGLAGRSGRRRPPACPRHPAARPLGAGTVGAMAVGKRARLTLDERRAQLVELGADVFRDRPYDEVSIDDIAAAAGVSKGLLYHYFDGKREFYVAALRHAAEEIEALTEPDEDLAPETRLRAAIEGYLDYVEQHAAGYASVLRAGSGVDPAVAAVIEGVRERMGERVLRELPGDQGDAPAVRLAVRAWIGFAEAASLAWAERGGIDRAGLGDLLTAVLGTALARTAAAAP